MTHMALLTLARMTACNADEICRRNLNIINKVNLTEEVKTLAGSGWVWDLASSAVVLCTYYTEITNITYKSTQVSLVEREYFRVGIRMGGRLALQHGRIRVGLELELGSELGPGFSIRVSRETTVALPT